MSIIYNSAVESLMMNNQNGGNGEMTIESVTEALKKMCDTLAEQRKSGASSAEVKATEKAVDQAVKVADKVVEQLKSNESVLQSAPAQTGGSSDAYMQKYLKYKAKYLELRSKKH